MKERIVSLRQQAAEAVECAQALDKLAQTEKRRLNDEETTKFDKHMADYEGFLAEVRRLEKLDSAVTDIGQPAKEPVRQESRAGSPGATAHDNAEDAPFAGGFGEYLQCVYRAAKGAAEGDSRALDPRLRRFDLRSHEIRAASGLNEKVDSEGGFLVSNDVSKELMKTAFDTGVLASRTRQIPIGEGSNGFEGFYIDETSRATGSRWGGIRAYWADEADEKTANKPKFGKLEMKLKKLVGLCYATDENLQDATQLDAIIRQGFGEEFSFQVDDAIVEGSGAGAPLGYMNSPALVTVAKETSQAADTIKFENVAKMRMRMPPRYFANAVWLTNIDTDAQLQSMFAPHKNLAGTENVGGQSVYMPPGGISGNVYGTLYGRPVIPVEFAATLGDLGDIMLVDLKQYLLITKGGMQSASSIHVRFIYDETAFRFVMRVNGMPWHKSAITPFKGAATLSPFVTLAERA